MAAMRRWWLLLFPVLLAVLVPVRGNFDDLNLEDAFDMKKKPFPSQKTPSLDLGNFDDLELADAFDTKKKPLPSEKTPPLDLDYFDLADALRPDGPKPNPPAKPRDTDKSEQDRPKDTGALDETDLFGGNLPKGGGDGSGSNERRGQTPDNGKGEEASQGAIAGIVSAVAATVIGAVSSFIAYQKKKLCFKQSADEENVNMDSHRGAQSEPPVQRTLLEN